MQTIIIKAFPITNPINKTGIFTQNQIWFLS